MLKPYKKKQIYFFLRVLFVNIWPGTRSAGKKNIINHKPFTQTALIRQISRSQICSGQQGTHVRVEFPFRVRTWSNIWKSGGRRFTLLPTWHCWTNSSGKNSLEVYQFLNGVLPGRRHFCIQKKVRNFIVDIFSRTSYCPSHKLVEFIREY